MPKIRGVKPDLWTDEGFVELSPFARLLWIGMWNFACDNGHLQDKSKQIKMRVLPTDDVNCAELLREIEDQGLIERAGGWITIPNLSHHQKPHKRWYVVCDKPGCEMPEGASYGFPKRGSTVEQPLSNGGTTVNNGGSTADGDVDGDGDLKVKETPRASARETEPDRFDEFWTTYDKRRGRKAALAKYRIALKKPGVTEDLLIAAAAAYIEWQRFDGKHPHFTKDPATWLHGEHWTDERPGRIQPQTRVQEHLTLVQQLAAEEADQPTIAEIGYRQ
jgi:hypothetical protein